MTPRPRASCCIPTAGIQSYRPILSLFILLSVLLGLVATTTAWAIDIEDASWSNRRDRLTVRGENAPDNATVTIRYGDRFDNGAEIGTTEADGDGDWEFRISGNDLNPIPCDVTAQAGNDDADRGVRRAPNDCSNGGGNQPPPPNNNAPVCTINSPSVDVTIQVGNSVDFSGTADGNIASVSWTFPGGNPTSSNEQNVDNVTYGTAGTFIASFSATENDGTSCAQQTRTITVQDNNNPPPPPLVDVPAPVGQENNAGLLGRDQGTHVLLGANDLGMHCADQDDSIFSVLPPFNVLHAQVILRGSTPQILSNADVSVVYSAASNTNDPVGPGSINSTSANFPLGGAVIPLVYKGNFWDVNPNTGNLQGFDTYSPLFFGLLSPAALVQDLGLPAPETPLLTACLPAPLGTGAPDGSDCAFAQQAMPGISDPYFANVPQGMHFDVDTGFFNDLLSGVNGVTGEPLGSVVTNVNWFRADGIPILPVDDSGRGNAYPLVRVQALQGNTAVASTDVVLPVAAEADCQLCHADPIDCADPGLPADIQSDQCNGIAITPTQVSNSSFVVETIDVAPGDTTEQKLLNAAKINILRLHDTKHGTTLDATRNVVCASCHYSPALDLAQVGPQNIGATQQVGNISMSRAMHGHHGDLQVNGQLVFPDMPPPDQRAPGEQQQVLEDTCYQCHPGKRTQCLRGAMGGSGIVCQDCHGNMTQVGDDFTGNPNGRVPWASEPKCQSCHTGDVRSLNRPGDTIVAPDGIRLLQAYPRSEHINNGGDATPIVATASRWAENETLYRLSGNDDGSGKGHGGIMCEGCHGSTHAIWPNANPNANDNVAANQLQGHTGTLTECTTCHTGNLGNTLNGPHGMHPVGRTGFADGGHEDLGEDNPDACRACHGEDGEGTVLSAMHTDRVLDCDNDTAFCPNGNSVLFPEDHQVGCTECHDNEL